MQIPPPVDPRRGGPVGQLTDADVASAGAFLARLALVRGPAAKYLIAESKSGGVDGDVREAVAETTGEVFLRAGVLGGDSGGGSLGKDERGKIVDDGDDERRKKRESFRLFARLFMGVGRKKKKKKEAVRAVEVRDEEEAGGMGLMERAENRADAVVRDIAAKLTDDDAPFLGVRVGDVGEDLRAMRAAHRLMLGALSFDGAAGLVAADGVTEGSRELDEWYGCDSALAESCKDYRRHVKALAMLQAVARNLQDAGRAVERAAAAGLGDPRTIPSSASVFEGSGGAIAWDGATLGHRRSLRHGAARPNRFWTDAREKAAQVTVLVSRLAKYDRELPIVRASRGGNGGLVQATRLLHAPMPVGSAAPERVEGVRVGLVDAREVALESVEKCGKEVEAIGARCVEGRMNKLRADCNLMDVRMLRVERAVKTVESEPASLRVMFEVIQIIKAQLREARVDSL